METNSAQELRKQYEKETGIEVRATGTPAWQYIHWLESRLQPSEVDNGELIEKLEVQILALIHRRDVIDANEMVNVMRRCIAALKGHGREVDEIEEHVKRGMKVWNQEKAKSFIGSVYYPLWKLMNDEHGLILLDSEMNEIIIAAHMVEQDLKDEHAPHSEQAHEEGKTIEQIKEDVAKENEHLPMIVAEWKEEYHKVTKLWMEVCKRYAAQTHPPQSGKGVTEEIKKMIYQTVGHASLCWNPRPSIQTFDEAEAKIAAELLIEFLTAQLKEGRG